MCNISVIIPFYKGNKYLTGLKQSLENACISYEGKVEVMVCPYMMSQDSDALKCGNFIDRPSASHCGECKYKKIGRKHFEEMNAFFINNNEKICRVIFPSCSAEKNWLNVFPSLAEKSIVRPHLKYDILNEEKKWNKTIRIGYLGFISDIKGYSEWLQLMRKLDNRKFDFYYFGGTVDQAEKDGAMSDVQVDYLEVENNIVKERNVFENYFHKCLSKSLK